MQIKRNKALFSSRKSKTFYEEIYTDSLEPYLREHSHVNTEYLTINIMRGEGRKRGRCIKTKFSSSEVGSHQITKTKKFRKQQYKHAVQKCGVNGASGWLSGWEPMTLDLRL